MGEQEIYNKMRKLQKVAAPGLDGFTLGLQQLSTSQLKPLEILNNKSLETGEIQEEWKIAIVNCDRGNSRPVSLTSVLYKLMETIIKDRIMQHSFKLLKTSQHKFMPGMSCVTDLVTFVPVNIIYLDFVKEFDKVPRQRLQEKWH